MQVITEGFYNTLTIKSITSIKPYQNKDKTVFNITVSAQKVTMIEDLELGFKESTESLNVKFPCSSSEEVRQLSTFLVNCRTKNQSFNINTTLPTREAFISNWEGVSRINYKDYWDCVSLTTPVELYSKPVQSKI